MGRCWRRVVIIIFLSLLGLCPIGTSKDKQPKSYPEHGTVIAVKTSEQILTNQVQTDDSGKTSGGSSIVWHLPVYRVETNTKFYELEARSEKKRDFSLGDVVQFRIEKQWAYVQQGTKEKKFRIISAELKPSPKS